MELLSEQKSSLCAILREPDLRDALDAAFKVERLRLESMALDALNSRRLPEAERFAAFAGAYKSAMSRLISLSEIDKNK
jgi:hypothetical protein